MKYYTSDEISLLLDNVSKDQKINILYAALDYMQQYNGRTKFRCISMAMGFENNEGDDKSYFKIKHPKLLK